MNRSRQLTLRVVMDGVSQWGKRLLLLSNICLFAVALYIVGGRGLLKANDGIEYKDLIAILLTVLAVLLAAVTIFVAGLAVWGYAALRDAAARSAEDVAERVAADVASTVAAREVPNAVRLFSGAAGQVSSGLEDQAVADELKGGSSDAASEIN